MIIWCVDANMKFLDPLGKIQKELALVDVPFWKNLKNHTLLSYPKVGML